MISKLRYTLCMKVLHMVNAFWFKPYSGVSVMASSNVWTFLYAQSNCAPYHGLRYILTPIISSSSSSAAYLKMVTIHSDSNTVILALSSLTVRFRLVKVCLDSLSKELDAKFYDYTGRK